MLFSLSVRVRRSLRNLAEQVAETITPGSLSLWERERVREDAMMGDPV